MEINVPAGRYVVAVSGGVDSMVLLDLLAKQAEHANMDLVIAHFNHGIQGAAAKTAEKLVVKTARAASLEVEVGQARLGKAASEEKARDARYQYLIQVKHKYQARAIITAHHQDDLVETALLNTLRGSGWRGLVAILRNPNVKRPLINVPKADLLKYAKTHKLKWQEDITNTDEKYLRNRLRSLGLGTEDKQKILNNIEKVAKIDEELNITIATISHKIAKNSLIDRQKFSALPTDVANELVIYWLREKALAYDRQTVDRLTVHLKTASVPSRYPIKGKAFLSIGAKFAKIKTP
ncbi:MAG: tRNA lysidine(34) synthetase TilS [Candidatus Saccharimonadales bacterium]